MKLILRNPKVDHYSCVTRLIEDLLSQVKDQIGFGRRTNAFIEGDLFMSGSRYGKLSNALNLALLDYERVLNRTKNETPFSPGGTRQPALQAVEVNRMLSVIKNQCGEGMDVTYLDKVILDRISGITEGMNSSCRQNLSRHFAALLLSTEPRVGLCAQGQDCPRQKHIRAALAILSAARLTPYLRSDAPFSGDCANCNLELNDTMRRFLFNTRQTAACVQPKPGESIKINHDTGTNMIFNPTKYTLTRLQDRIGSNGKRVAAYQATLNISFEYAELLPKQRKAMYARTRECFREAAPKLLGPNGEMLEIKLASDNPEVPVSALPHIVAIAEVRNAFWAWPQSSDCSDILHESLHMMGLVDEYPEQEMGARVDADGAKMAKEITQFDCRVIGPRESIMWSNRTALELASDGMAVKACRCDQCVPNAMSCAKSLTDWKKFAPSCPPESNSYLGIGLYRDLSNAKFAPGEKIKDGGVIVESHVAEPAKRRSLLLPAHFRAITAPGCEVNDVYYACAREAYKTSPRFYGKNRCEENLPKQCRSGSIEWLK